MRILFVSMANSIHTARWIGQLSCQRWDIHLYPVANGPPHPDLNDLTIHGYFCYRPARSGQRVRQAGLWWPFPRGAGVSEHIVARVAPWQGDRAGRLAETIHELQPDIVHSLEMQHAGYLTLEAKNRLDGQFPPWIYSSWGSDLFFFGRKAEHETRIRSVLASCDYYIADCRRDVHLAREFGFKGEVLGVFPVSGGFDVESVQRLHKTSPVSSRRTIALKGYHDDGWAGRALIALQAFHMCADQLADYEIAIYLASANVRRAARHLARSTGLQITVLPHVPRDDILKLLGRARLAIGVNITDGTPNSMLEAMAMGAFPIQSDTISTAEWITHGENGLLVPPEDPHAVAAALRRALTDDALVDQAAERNARIVADRLDRTVIQPQVLAMYERVATDAATKKEDQ